MFDHHFLLWGLFNGFVLAMLALDWLVLQRNTGQPAMSSAWIATSFWVALAGGFGLGLYLWLGRAPAVEFTTAYLVEESLSIDNLFIFLLIFRSFGVPSVHQRKVLLWGVLGAMVMRLAFILAGVGLIERFHWFAYLLGAFLVFVGVRTIKGREPVPANRRLAVRNWVRRFIPLTDDYVGGQFFVRQGGWFATPLLLVLLVIELTDLTFAIDSIPAVLGI
ncbi:MAG: TerC family protein, partial [Terriglobales bacterium]